MTGHEQTGGWEPSPELLAAYFDGECEGRDDLADVRRRLEDWLSSSPRGRAELAEYRQLRQIWVQSTPAEPSPEAWQAVRNRVEAAQPVPQAAKKRVRRHGWRVAGLVAAAAGVVLATGVLNFSPGPALDEAPFPVASAREIVILRVEGDDAGTLVVGELPLQGPLELVAVGEVTLTSAQPAPRDNMMPDLELNGPGPPMIWARPQAEED
jgi:anti-sigma-K factor RskA